MRDPLTWDGPARLLRGGSGALPAPQLTCSQVVEFAGADAVQPRAVHSVVSGGDATPVPTRRWPGRPRGHARVVRMAPHALVAPLARR